MAASFVACEDDATAPHTSPNQTAPALTDSPAGPPGTTTPEVSTSNGWIAWSEGPDETEAADLDIWLLALDKAQRRVAGTDTDTVAELCPAFSPDGRRLAYGRIEGTTSALAVVDVHADGQVSDAMTVDVGEGLPPPCPIWSPDGTRVAFGVPRTSPVNPTTSAVGSEVWIVRLSDNGVTVLPDMLATDLEWSPDNSLLAIASGVDEVAPGNVLNDGRIYLYELATGTIRTLDGTRGAYFFTWSPDGGRIAYQGIADQTNEGFVDLRVIDIATGQQYVFATTVSFTGLARCGHPMAIGSCTKDAQHSRGVASARITRSSWCPRKTYKPVVRTPGKSSSTRHWRRLTLPAHVTCSRTALPGRLTASMCSTRHGGEPVSHCPPEPFPAAVPIEHEQSAVRLNKGLISGGRDYEGYPSVFLTQTWGVRISN